MATMWHTSGPTETSTVEWGLHGDVLNHAATGSAASYFHAYEHRVLMTSLRPSTTYDYRVGDASGGWSAVKSFTTAKVSHSARRALSTASHNRNPLRSQYTRRCLP